ncbi:hypothetical protein [Actinoallomurus sp. NPDC052274]|uniref:hypothetical protein n=1 Tax=Actinoallomurus sp. NPDC052274 TaxID=3155420 RepID=UPI0034387E8D
MSERTEGAEPRGEGAEPRRPNLRTGSETPVDPEDLAMAEGRDPTPENIERARRRIERLGAREAVDRVTP